MAEANLLEGVKAAPTKLRRTVDSWRGMRPETVVAGSEAQVLYCLKDAQHDILVLAAALAKAQS